MDIEKVGKAIAYLRKRAGYTQKDLADRIGVSDKAVSKWERGLGLPEISCLSKLSILLDTDTDSLLAGDVVHHDSTWSGIILLDENMYGIGADTFIYDKPLINYLLSYFLLVGIRDITVICSRHEELYINERLGNGSEYGIKLNVVVGGLKSALNMKQWNGNVLMVYGRCLLYGVDQTRFFQKAMLNRDHFTMMVLPKKVSHGVPRVVIDIDKKVIDSNSNEQLKTQYDFSDIPILFFPGNLLADIASEKDVSTFVAKYAIQNELYVHMLDRGFVEIEMDDWDSVQDASTFIKIVQDKCGMNVYCIEEVAWRRGLISLQQLKYLGDRSKGTKYGDYIMSLYHRIAESEGEE